MNKSAKESIFSFFLFAFIFFIPVSSLISIRILILTIILSLFLIRNSNWRYDLVNNSWDLFIYFFVLLGGLIYTEDMSSGLSVIEKNLSFIMIPLLFSRMRVMDKLMLNKICLVFVMGVLAASAICLGFAVWRDMALGVKNSYYYEEFTAIIDSHPTYMAYYVCFSIIFFLYLISYESFSRSRQLLIFAAIVFLSLILMFTASRSTFVSMLMMSSFFFLKLLFEPHPVQKKIQGITATVVLLLVLLLQSPYYQKMFPQFLSGRSLTLSKVTGDSWDRLVLWESALSASSNLVTGVGTGDYTSVMNDYYMRNNLPQYAESNFNAHNQFIQTLFSNGAIGLIALLLVLSRPVLLSSSRKNILGMLTFFPFFIYGISEVFLGRFQGIIFFTLLHTIWITFLNQNTARFSPKSNNQDF